MANKVTRQKQAGQRRNSRSGAVTGIEGSTREAQARGQKSPKQKNAKPRAQAARPAESGNGKAPGKAAGNGANKKKNPLQRAVSTVADVLTRAKARLTRGRKGEPVNVKPMDEPEVRPKKKVAKQKAARVARRETDIPIEVISAAYTPTQTSLKAPFRADGADHQRDQEFASGKADTRWNDEDHYTNKSGDPRIGTHGRSYEPAEGREKERVEYESE